MAVVGAQVPMQAGALVAFYRRTREGREGLEGLQRGAGRPGEARGGRGVAGASWSAHRAFCAAWRTTAGEGKFGMGEGRSRLRLVRAAAAGRGRGSWCLAPARHRRLGGRRALLTVGRGREKREKERKGRVQFKFHHIFQLKCKKLPTQKL
jgi:hypothetical protein